MRFSARENGRLFGKPISHPLDIQLSMSMPTPKKTMKDLKRPQKTPKGSRNLRRVQKIKTYSYLEISRHSLLFSARENGRLFGKAISYPVDIELSMSMSTPIKYHERPQKTSKDPKRPQKISKELKG